MGKRNINFNIWWPDRPKFSRTFWQYLIPHPGTLLLSLLLIGGLLWAQSVGALSLGRHLGATTASSTGTIAYQGRLADSAGSPLTGTYNMIFRLYSASSGGTPLWEEQWTGSNGVRVSDGLFNVMLGSLTQIPQAVVTGQDQLFLGITVGTDDEMAPRVQLGSVPFAVQALTVPDESVTSVKLADGAVTQEKLADGVIGQLGGQPHSFPYILHLRHFGLSMGNYCLGYVPGDPEIVGSYPNCAGHPGLSNFTFGVKTYVPSGNGAIRAANNLPNQTVDFVAQTVTSSPRWGYAYSFFLNNADVERSFVLPLTSCNDVAVYVSAGQVTPDVLGSSSLLQYHRFPGNTGDDLLGCQCQGLNPTIQVPSGSFRISLITRGAACTSYMHVGEQDAQGLPLGNWIQDAGLSIDWSGLRTYLGEY